MSRANDDRLKAALDALTTAMSAPVISGELVDWFDVAIDAVDKVGTALVEQVDHAHPSLFQEIGAEDQEMLPLVERLKQEDQELISQARQLKADLEHYRKASEKLESKETFLQEPLTKLNDQWLELFGRVNKQQVGITTWLQEALQRDRGAVD